MDEEPIVEALAQLPTGARAALRRLLIADQSYKDAAAERLLRKQGRTAIADLLDHLSLDAQSRRTVVRLLGEIEARTGSLDE